jgi:NCAIR mutase (PurE)-related protein
MDQDKLKQLLEQVREGAVGVDDALGRLKHMPFEDLGFAKVDHHRAIRNGMPEVIFGKGKAPGHVAEIASRLAERSPNLLATRVEPAAAALLLERLPEAEHFPASGVVRLWRDRTLRGKGTIVVACAGTSDIPVAEEARLTAETMGNRVETIFDIGVAGIHRLMANRERLTQARVCVVCAGMEGALPSAVGGLVSCPVIAVPTSIGYGASFNGLAALLGMLNSCASNVTVVNIDNGFGGGYVAGLINRLE